MPSAALLAAQKMVVQIELDLESARRNWAIFHQSNGKDDTERENLRTAIAYTHAAHAFAYIQTSCATNTVLALARITDPRGGERNSLDALRGIIGPIQGEIAEDALTWYDGLNPSAVGDLGTKAKEEVARKLPELISGIADLLKCEEVSRIRSLRNEALAHALGLSSILPTYDDLATVYQRVRRLVALASYLICARHWDPKNYDEVSETYAREFWDAVEHGISTMKAKGLA